MFWNVLILSQVGINVPVSDPLPVASFIGCRPSFVGDIGFDGKLHSTVYCVLFVCLLGINRSTRKVNMLRSLDSQGKSEFTSTPR